MSSIPVKVFKCKGCGYAAFVFLEDRLPHLRAGQVGHSKPEGLPNTCILFKTTAPEAFAELHHDAEVLVERGDLQFTNVEPCQTN